MTRRLRIVDAAPARTARSRAELLLEAAKLYESLSQVHRELAACEPGADGALVDVLRAVPASKRSILRACRLGEIAGAAKVGRRWLAPQSSIDAWLRARGPRVVKAAHDEDDLEDLRRELSRTR